MKTLDIDTLIKHSNELKSDCIHYFPDIPPRKRDNALKAFEIQLAGDQILMLIDNTVIKNGKRGLILTKNAIYARNQTGKTLAHKLEEIRSISVKSGFVSELRINEKKFWEIIALEKKKIPALVKTLQELILPASQPAPGPAPDPSPSRAAEKKKESTAGPQDDVKFQLQITGKFATSIPFTEIVERISEKFGLDSEKAEALLKNTPKVIKKELDPETAKRYKNAFDSSGVECRVIPEGQPVSASAGPDQPAPVPTPFTPSGMAPLHPGKFSSALRKINMFHYSHQMLNLNLPRQKEANLKSQCGIPEDVKVLACVQKARFAFLCLISPQGICWKEKEIIHRYNLSEFITLKVSPPQSGTLMIGPDLNVESSNENDLLTLYDVFTGIQHFMKHGTPAPESLFLFQPERCPRCGSTQLMRTQKNKMNWGVAAATSLFGGPVLGAALGSKEGKMIDVIQCNRCFHARPVEK